MRFCASLLENAKSSPVLVSAQINTYPRRRDRIVNSARRSIRHAGIHGKSCGHAITRLDQYVRARYDRKGIYRPGFRSLYSSRLIDVLQPTVSIEAAAPGLS